MSQLYCRCLSRLVRRSLQYLSLRSHADVLPRSAASALAANSVLRSIAGAGFPLFSTYMVRSTLLANSAF
jgi:hypothetical protein